MPTRETKRITMRQIAARARVSVGTVSHVINNTAGVREPVKQRVLEAIERLGYQPSLLARGLRRNQTTIIGVIIPDISNPFFPLVVRGVEDIAYQNSYRLMLCNTDNDAQKEQVYFNELRAYRMAGLIVIPSADSRLVPLASGHGGEIPVICLDRCPEGWKGDTVTVDNEGGAYQAIRYLLELGHRRIACIAGQLHVTSGVERLKGFKRALREAGITTAPEYIQEGRFDRLSGYEKALMLLQFSPRPTAIFAANDLVALGVLAATRELGLRCPEDVSLVGFDDLELASFTNPALTTVAQPAYQMGARAAGLLFERLRGEGIGSQRIVMKATLKARDSTAAPGRG
ncbi:MAG TPA: LacI family DNA-binding transcriptional regulator [Terriglobales bacterium]|nr:LacI family DNA-binding transcriptional regulator [Terriglobales bacterium]